jgi:hypothetical protein
LEQRRDRLQRWAASARRRYRQVGRRVDRCAATCKVRGEMLYRELNDQQDALVAQGIAEYVIRRTIRERKAEIDADLSALRSRWGQAERERDAEWRKLERYCREQRVVLRQLDDLNTRAQQMYEVDNAKDQIMTVCKVALVNLGMYLREQCFPASYAHATWKRLKPFFELKGRITGDREVVSVELRAFNDRQLNHDLAEVCARVERAHLRLLDGRRLVLTLAPAHRPVLNAHRRC